MSVLQRCPSYRGVRLIEVSVKRESTVVSLVKYCSIWKKNANYRRPLKMSIRRAIFGFTLVMVGSKWSKLADLWLIFKERNVGPRDHIF